jgi:hypothetical protein
MSYLTQNEIASNPAMQNRVAQAATSEDIPHGPDTEPITADQWTIDHRREWAAAPGWDAAWESAKVSHPNDPDAPPGTDYDPGLDEAVITDGQILSQIQAMLT